MTLQTDGEEIYESIVLLGDQPFEMKPLMQFNYLDGNMRNILYFHITTKFKSKKLK